MKKKQLVPSQLSLKHKPTPINLNKADLNPFLHFVYVYFAQTSIPKSSLFCV